MADPNAPTGGAVFLSYAREDADAARRIADALRAFGVEVWFDQSELRGGDAWDQKIRTQIKTCTLFVPVVSQRTEARSEGYFRREWKLAIDRTHDMAPGRPFIVPVVVDETAESGAAVPEEFMRYQWTRLVRGEPTPDFVAQIKRLIDGPKRSAAPTPSWPAPAATPRAEPPSRGSPLPIIFGAIAAVAIGAAIYFAQRGKSAEPVVAATAPKLAAVAPAAAASIANEKSIAVLPFANLSEEKEASFFADGIHEDILTNLALVRELHVVSRTSVMQYRGTTKPIRQIATELGVAYVLEGSVRRAGNKVRVTGQLIKAATDEHVWANNYDRDLTDIFSLQSELSQAIARALSAALSPQEKQLLERRPTENLAAYDAYVKARQLRQGSGTNLLPAAELLQRAVSLDPNFAAAWAELGAQNAFLYFNDTDHSEERLAKATAAIETAQHLAPDAPEVIEKVGDYYYYGFHDYTRAREQYQRLAILRPNDAVISGSLGLINRRQGRWREALADLRRACELEPRNLRYLRSLMSTANAGRRYDEALAAQRAVVEASTEKLAEQFSLFLIPFAARGSTQEGDATIAAWSDAERSSPMGKYLAIGWLRTKGDFAEAIRRNEDQRYFDVFGEARGVQDAAAALVLAAAGRRAEARQRAEAAIQDLQAIIGKQSSNATLWANLGNAYAILGNKGEALRCADKARELLPEAKDAVAGPGMSVARGACLAWLGDKEAALAELARLLQVPNGENVFSARSGANWFPLRGDPRFEALLNDPRNNAPLF